MIKKITIKHIDLFTAQLLGDSLIIPPYTIDDCSFLCRLFSAKKMDLERLTVDDYLSIDREDYLSFFNICKKSNKIRFATDQDKVWLVNYFFGLLKKIDKFFAKLGKNVTFDKQTIMAREISQKIQRKYNIPPAVSFIDLVAKSNNLSYKEAGELPICQALWRLIIDEQQQEITKAVGKEFLKNGNK